MTFDELRRKFSQIIRAAVPPHSLSQVVIQQDADGYIGQKELLKMVIELYTYLEEQNGHE